MKAWLEQYRRDHPLRYELLMAKVRQTKRTASPQHPERDDGADRFDHDAGPFGHDR